MKQIRYLPTVLTSTVLIFGLIGCGSDSNSDKSNSNSPWSVGKITLVRGSDNKKINLKTADEELPNFYWNDEIVFSAQKKPVQVSVTTDCYVGQEKLGQYTFTEEIKQSYRFFELLPQNAIQNSISTTDTPVFCSVTFKAQNNNGSTHSFKLKPAPVLPAQTPPYLSINQNMTILERKDHNPFVIRQSELHTYTLPALEGNAQYTLFCKSLKAQISNMSGPVRLDYMVYNRDQDSTSQVDKCRIFKITNRVVAMSDEFVFRFTSTAPVIQAVGISDYIQEQYNIVSLPKIIEYHISNPTDSDMHFALNDHDQFVKLTGIYRESPFRRNNYIASSVYTKLLADITPPAITKPFGHSQFTIAAKSKAILNIYQPFKIFECKGRMENIAGNSGNFRTNVDILYSYNDDDGLVLNQIADSNQAADTANIINSIQLESNMGRYFYVVASFNNPPRIKPSSIPPIQRYTENECRIIN